MPIELVQAGPFMLLQFNMGCGDALTACKAHCCRLRPQFNVEVTDEEAKWMKWVEIGPTIADPARDPKKVLRWNENGDCIYLAENR